MWIYYMESLFFRTCLRFANQVLLAPSHREHHEVEDVSRTSAHLHQHLNQFALQRTLVAGKSLRSRLRLNGCWRPKNIINVMAVRNISKTILFKQAFVGWYSFYRTSVVQVCWYAWSGFHPYWNAFNRWLRVEGRWCGRIGTCVLPNQSGSKSHRERVWPSWILGGWHSYDQASKSETSREMVGPKAIQGHLRHGRYFDERH